MSLSFVRDPFEQGKRPNNQRRRKDGVTQGRQDPRHLLGVAFIMKLNTPEGPDTAVPHVWNVVALMKSGEV